MAGERKRLGDLLIEAQLIAVGQLEASLIYQRKWGGRLGSILVTLGFLTEEKLLAFLAERFNLPSVNLKKTRISDKCLAMVPAKVAKKYLLIPVEVKTVQGKDCLVVAMSDPTNVQAIDEVRVLCHLPIQPALAPDLVVEQAISHYYDKTGSFLDEDGITYEHLTVTYLPSTPVVDHTKKSHSLSTPADGSTKSADVPGKSTGPAQATLSAQAADVPGKSTGPAQATLPAQAADVPGKTTGPAQATPSAPAADVPAGATGPSEIQQLRTAVRAISSLLISKGVINQREWDDAIQSLGLVE